MNFETIESIWKTISDPNLVAKFFLIIISFLFLTFSIIIMRQIYILNNLVRQVNFSSIFQGVSFILVIMATIYLIFVIFIL